MDERVSWNHARIWVELEKVWLADTGSRNGTFVNSVQVKGTVALRDGDEIRLGSGTVLSVRMHTPDERMPRLHAYALEEVGTGVRHLLKTERFYIGSAPTSDVRVPGAGPDEANVLVHPEGEIWLGRDEEETLVEVGTEFSVGGLNFRIVEVETTRLPTLDPAPGRYRYRLSVTLDGPTGPLAKLESLDGRHSCSVDAETRAVLLYLLGRQIALDRTREVPFTEEGWCADEDVIVGVWGRSGLADGANRLKVLVHRLRKELKRADFDPWFIERKKRYIRVRVAEVTVDS